MKTSYISVFYSEEDEGYFAYIPDLQGCSAFGKSIKEALQKILIAQAAWLEAAQA
jgi:predicted RNase H-like HicB family nuclease